MALFTRGLTKVARLGVNSRIGAAVACYHKNVRLLFSLVFNFTGCRIATVVSRETQIILHARYGIRFWNFTELWFTICSLFSAFF